MAVAQTHNTAELVAKDKAHMVHPVTNIKQVRKPVRSSFLAARASTSGIPTASEYIDGFAGLWNVNVGHGRHRAGGRGRGADR